VVNEREKRMIGNQLKAARAKAKLSRHEAAQRAGIGRQHLWYIENDKGNPTIELLQLLSEIYKFRFIIMPKE
jgi:transcriptional regulator with XRE-family HTH domain